MNNTTQQITTPIDVEKRVGQYVKLRDLKAELKDRHESELKPITETMLMLEEELKSALQSVNAANMRTNAGTVSLTIKASASCPDQNAFWTWVVTQGLFDYVDKKPNVTAITEYVKANGVAPPGVNYSTYQTIGVRRAK